MSTTSASRVIETESVTATHALGERLAAAVRPGDVIALIGELGAGKTQLVKGIARGLGVADEHRVTSPTFVLIHEYKGRLPIFHADAYRLHSGRELADVGIEEDYAAGGVTIIEWADRAADCLPEAYLRIEIAITGETCRRFALADVGGTWRGRLATIQGSSARGDG
jgi:tRNA threonylcarbamoyladenosine biosynthesis protein TsaE